ncbi:MAG: hypothetical protein ACYTGV_02180 [Planctomycetota bacterium]|jgi:hypothetical protein
MTWGGALPKKMRKPEPGSLRPKPVLVYIPSPHRTRDQERFEEVVLRVQQFVLCSRFFSCVEISAASAEVHPLLEDKKFKTPVLVVFDSSLKKRAVVHSRASAMKAYGAMRKIGQPDYVTNIKETLRKAKVLLGDFDQVDAARKVLQLKKTRLETALGKGEKATARKLEKEIEHDQAQIDEIYEKAEREWNEIWDLQRKKVP